MAEGQALIHGTEDDVRAVPTFGHDGRPNALKLQGQLMQELVARKIKLSCAHAVEVTKNLRNKPEPDE